MTFIFKIIGVIGLILIIAGIFRKNKKQEDLFFSLGGVFLLGYSIYLKDIIFSVLQVAFILSAMYNYYTLRGKTKKK